MRNSLAERVLPTFEALIRDRLPQLALIEAKGGDFLFGRDLGPIRVFVFLQLSERQDSFTINVGWAEDGLWPAMAFKVRPPALDGGPVPAGAWFRLARLWNGHGEGEWWSVGSSAMDRREQDRRVSQEVTSAVESLVKYGVPYLAEVANHLSVGKH